MGKYATTTTVSVEKSRGEIEKLLMRYGCSEFAYRNTLSRAQIAFVAHGRAIRFDLPLPHPEDFALSPSGRRTRSEEAKVKAWEQACRSAWRGLALIIKAKLEAVEVGITTFEIEFLPHVVVPGGRVFHELALPQLEESLQTGRLPPLLGGGS